MMSQSQKKGKQGTNGSGSTRNCSRWSLAEDRALIGALEDLLEIVGWKADNGQFKSGAYGRLEELMKKRIPESEKKKKAKPHIESRVKLLRRQYDAIVDMLSPSASGFGWNDEGKFVTCPLTVWEEWLKSHSNASGLRNKPFPFFDELGKIFGKDRATGTESGNAEDILEELEEDDRGREQEHVDFSITEDANPTSQSSKMGPLPSTAPSSSKTKRARTKTIDALKEFSAKIGKMSVVMETASEHIGRLASCFQHESDSAERRMQLPSEIMKIEGLTPDQVLLASKKIALSPLEVDFFFSLPKDYKYAYVQSLLL